MSDNVQKMRAPDAISGKLGRCYVTINGERFFLMQVTNVEAKMDKNKTEVPILGRTGVGHKSAGWSGTGDMTLYYNTSMFRKLLHAYKETGQDVYFDMQITNEDPTSSVGRQTVMLLDCNIDGAVLAKLDVGSDVLDEDVSFTFDDFDMPEEFTELKGMR